MKIRDPRIRRWVAELEEQKDEIAAPCNPAHYRILKRIVANPDNFFVLGFGAGAIHGLAGNCALAAIIDELELRPHVKQVWGVSAGAVIAGLPFIQDVRSEDTATAFRSTWNANVCRSLSAAPSAPALARAMADEAMVMISIWSTSGLHHCAREAGTASP